VSSKTEALRMRADVDLDEVSSLLDSSLNSLLHKIDAYGVHCCTERQSLLLVNYGLYVAVGITLWKSRLLTPFKLFGTMLHELSHAFAALLCCARVDGIELHSDQSGTCHWSVPTTRLGCVQNAVVPAGYLGSVLWAGGILICCTHDKQALRCTAVLVLLTFIVLLYSLFGKVNRRDNVLKILCVGIIFALSGLLALCCYSEWSHRYYLLTQVLLLIAATCTLDATKSLLDDCVFRTLPGSDSVLYADMKVGRTVCCQNPQIVGVVWFVIAWATLLLCLWIALWTTYDPKEREIMVSDGFSSYSKKTLSASVGLLVISLCYRRFCSQEKWY